MERNNKVVCGLEMVFLVKYFCIQYGKFGVIGYCYGGWVVFQFGVKLDVLFVDCIVVVYLIFLMKEEIFNVGVLVQIIVFEIDFQFIEEFKIYVVIEIFKLGVFFDYQYFFGLSYGFFIRGN